ELLHSIIVAFNFVWMKGIHSHLPATSVLFGWPETVEEQVLKDEIDYLKKELEKEALVNTNGESVQGSSGVQSSLRMEILNKEKELELLIHDLDDKVRFGQKAIERPGSGAGRSTGFSERPGSAGGRSIGNTERPPSQSGRSEEFRNVEYIDRPRSRGTSDAWTRPVDDRRAFQGTRERGFLSSREDRPMSRERW
ncbi:eukaryotic translation initiation factor 4B2-like, partial [Thalictrum thalictroides]